MSKAGPPPECASRSRRRSADRDHVVSMANHYRQGRPLPQRRLAAGNVSRDGEAGTGSNAAEWRAARGRAHLLSRGHRPREAGRLVLRGGTHLAADIRLVTTAVYTIRGVVYRRCGPGAVGASACSPLKPRKRPKAPAAKANPRDGMFEFRDVPRRVAPCWRSGSGTTLLKASAPVLLGRHDMENVTVRLAAPFELSGLVDPPESGKEPSVELYPSDAPPGLAVFARAKSDGTLRFPAVYPGRYRVNVFGAIPQHYLDSVRLGEQDVLGQEVLFAEGMPPLRVVYKPDAAALRGKVENGGGASILLLPQNEGLWNERFIRRASCDSSGHFEIDGLRRATIL